MIQVNTKWFVLLSLVVAMGCSKAESDKMAATKADEPSPEAMAAPSGGGAATPGSEERHEQRVENAKKAIPTIAEGGAT